MLTSPGCRLSSEACSPSVLFSGDGFRLMYRTSTCIQMPRGQRAPESVLACSLRHQAVSSQQARKSQDLPQGWDHHAPSVAGSSQEAGPFQSKCPCERVATGRSSGDLGAAGTISCCLGSEAGRSLPLGTEPWPIPCQAWAWFSTACWFQGTQGGGPGGCTAPVPRALAVVEEA